LFARRFDRFWPQFYNLEQYEVPAVTNMVLRSMTDEEIWENKHNAVWRLGRYDLVTVDFPGEVRAITNAGEVENGTLF